MDRYSDALDAQIEYARFWSSVEGERLFKKLTDFSKEQKVSDWEAGALKSFTTSPLIHGETFYWSPPICQLIFTTAESIPTSWTLRSDSLITPCGFSWLGTPFNMTGFRPIYAIGWVPFVYRDKNRIEVAPYPYNPILEGGLAISFFSKVQGVQKAVPLTVLLWDIDTDLTHPRHDEEAIKKMSVFATMMTFLQQRILVPSKFYADRVSRRRAERANVRPPSNEVQVVMFRRVERRTGEGEHRVEWTCHWIVRPHWRNQWYPSKKHYRPIPIAAYIKGPEDRPLRHSERLFAVVR